MRNRINSFPTRRASRPGPPGSAIARIRLSTRIYKYEKHGLIIGRIFGRLWVMEWDRKTSLRRKRNYYLANCLCGNKGNSFRGDDLLSGSTKSCGCLKLKSPVEPPMGLSYGHMDFEPGDNEDFAAGRRWG